MRNHIHNIYNKGVERIENRNKYHRKRYLKLLENYNKRDKINMVHWKDVCDEKNDVHRVPQNLKNNDYTYPKKKERWRWPISIVSLFDNWTHKNKQRSVDRFKIGHKSDNSRDPM